LHRLLQSNHGQEQNHHPPYNYNLSNGVENELGVGWASEGLNSHRSLGCQGVVDWPHQRMWPSRKWWWQRERAPIIIGLSPSMFDVLDNRIKLIVAC
jgi:hypothetical protein